MLMPKREEVSQEELLKMLQVALHSHQTECHCLLIDDIVKCTGGEGANWNAIVSSPTDARPYTRPCQRKIHDDIEALRRRYSLMPSH
jgi:hypothetical protein